MTVPSFQQLVEVNGLLLGLDKNGLAWVFLPGPAEAEWCEGRWFQLPRSVDR